MPICLLRTDRLVTLPCTLWTVRHFITAIWIILAVLLCPRASGPVGSFLPCRQPPSGPCTCAAKASQMRAPFASQWIAKLEESKLIWCSCFYCYCFKHNEGSKISTLVHTLTSCPPIATLTSVKDRLSADLLNPPQTENTEKRQNCHDQFWLEKQRNH